MGLTESGRRAIAELTPQYRPGWTLPRPFYSHPDLYDAEIELVWRRGWLFAGVAGQAARPGDHFSYQIDGDWVLVVRQRDGRLLAFHNLCRHRGSLLVSEPQGHQELFMCPYHQWTYALDGSLEHARAMPAGTEMRGLGLRRVPLEEVEGLLFICLAETPPDFEPARSLLGPPARPQGFGRARVAACRSYDVAADWKLVWENNRECFHCEVNHPQYVTANYDRYEGGSLGAERGRALAEAVARSRDAGPGLEIDHAEAGLAAFPGPGPNGWCSAHRTALAPGFVSESLDGRPVAPLMGDYTEADVPTLRLRTLPNFWCHASGDHAVLTRLTPIGPRATRIEVTWLVDAQAEPERDYRLERLLPFWQLTSEQDWAICERQQQGVDSRAYSPGPLSPSRERNVEAFHRWYLQQLGVAIGESPP